MANNVEFYKDYTDITPLYLNTQFMLQGINYSAYLGDIMYPLNILPTKGHAECNVASMLTLQWSTEDTHTNKYAEILNLLGVDSAADIDTQYFSIMQYLLNYSVCLVEVPKWKTTGGVKEPTYDKFLATLNVDLALKWAGITEEKTKKKYTDAVAKSDYANRELLLLKLTNKADEHKVTVPRKLVKMDKVICTPLIFLNAFTKHFVNNLKTNVYRVTYLKDNNSYRNIDTTLNENAMLQIYNQEFTTNTLENIHVKGVDNDWNIGKTLARGYISVPELGLSIYDYGTRAINLTRIVCIAQIQLSDVDTTFVNIDLEAVPEKFKRCAFVFVNQNNIEALRTIVAELENKAVTEYEGLDTNALYNRLVTFIDNYLIFGTPALRSLHLFLKARPQYFPNYVGERAVAENTVPTVSVNTADAGHLNF